MPDAIDVQALARRAGVEPWDVEPGYVFSHLWRDTAVAAMLAQMRREALEEAARVAETPVAGEQDDITMQAKDRVAAAIRRLGAPDADAIALYERTKKAHGFVNAPAWEELAEETREMYREHLRRLGASEEKG